VIAALVEHFLQKWFDFADINKMIDGRESLYLRRYYIKGYMSRRFKGNPPKEPVPSIFLHKICRSDEDVDPHDHPWSFFTVILWGSYTDEQWCAKYGLGGSRVVDKLEHCPMGSMHVRSATHLHRVILKPGKTVWTLVFTTPSGRPWGFHTTNGWVPWRKYLGISAEQESV
jgi:hypothetical protein